MEEHPTACTPQASDAKRTYFQIKDKETGLVLSYAEDYKTLVFAENKALATQIWYFFTPHDADQSREWNNIVSKATPHSALDLFRGTCNEQFCKIGKYGVHSNSNQMWKLDGNKFVGKWSSYTVLAEKDGTLVASKTGSETNFTWQPS